MSLDFRFQEWTPTQLVPAIQALECHLESDQLKWETVIGVSREGSIAILSPYLGNETLAPDFVSHIRSSLNDLLTTYRREGTRNAFYVIAVEAETEEPLAILQGFEKAEEGHVYMHTLFVREDRRRGGLGNSICQFALSELNKKGLKSLTAIFDPEDDSVVRFLKISQNIPDGYEVEVDLGKGNFTLHKK